MGSVVNETKYECYVLKENENIRCENTQIQLQTLNISQFVELPPLPTNLQVNVCKHVIKMS